MERYKGVSFFLDGVEVRERGREGERDRKRGRVKDKD